MPKKKLGASVGATSREMPPSPPFSGPGLCQAVTWHPPPHPALSWQAHMEAVHADWKEYLNLLICEESHLKYMEDYHEVPRQP